MNAFNADAFKVNADAFKVNADAFKVNADAFKVKRHTRLMPPSNAHGSTARLRAQAFGCRARLPRNPSLLSK